MLNYTLLLSCSQAKREKRMLACSRLFHSIPSLFLSTHSVHTLSCLTVHFLSTQDNHSNIHDQFKRQLTLFFLAVSLFFLPSLSPLTMINTTALVLAEDIFGSLPIACHYTGKKQWHLVDKPLLCLGRPVVPTMPLVSRFARCFPSFSNMCLFCTLFEL